MPIKVCIGITNSHSRTEYKQARFSSFTKGLQELCDWLAKYNSNDVRMESTSKYWIPVFNVLEKNNIQVTLSPQIHQAAKREQNRPQGCEMDLRPVYVRHGKVFLYSFR